MSLIYSLCEQALVGEVSPEYTKKRLKLIDPSLLEKIEIVVTHSKIIFVLNKYLTGEVDAKTLDDWASLILLEDVYVHPNWSTR